MENIEYAHSHVWLVARVVHPVERRRVDVGPEAIATTWADVSRAEVLLVCAGCHGFKTFEASRVE